MSAAWESPTESDRDSHGARQWRVGNGASDPAAIRPSLACSHQMSTVTAGNLKVPVTSRKPRAGYLRLSRWKWGFQIHLSTDYGHSHRLWSSPYVEYCQRAQWDMRTQSRELPQWYAWRVPLEALQPKKSPLLIFPWCLGFLHYPISLMGPDIRFGIRKL